MGRAGDQSVLKTKLLTGEQKWTSAHTIFRAHNINGVRACTRLCIPLRGLYKCTVLLVLCLMLPMGTVFYFSFFFHVTEKNMTKIHLPENGVGKGGCYCQLTMPDTDTNDVFVTHIKNPGCFWVQLITHYDQLTEIENEIRWVDTCNFMVI